MKFRNSIVFGALLAGALAPHAFAEAVSITVVPTLAPNAYGSPSWGQWQTNAVSALENGVSSYGQANSPTHYQAQSAVTSPNGIVTGFSSWMGQIDPNDTFGPAYAAELGNRFTFGLVILGNGNQFSISQLGFTASSNDPGNVLGFAYVGGYDYSDGYVGEIYGTNGSANQFINSGPSTQLVDALFARGSGNSLAASCGGTCTAADQQAAIDAAAAAQAQVTHFTGTYYLSPDGAPANISAQGSGTFDITPTPEPAAWMLMFATIPAVAVLRRRSAK